MSRSQCRRLGFEPLEDRRLLAVVMVTTTVDENNGTGNRSLREAVLIANAGDTIQFAPAVTGTISLNLGKIQIDKNLTIQGPGSGVLTIQAFDPGGGNNGNGERVFLVDGSGTLNVAISGLTLTNGDPADDESGGGGAIANHENLTLNACVLTDNFAPNGGAIFNMSGAGTLTINDSTIISNNAGDGAGILVLGGSLTINRSTISNNQASNAGGGIMSSGRDVNIVDCTIAGNSSPEGGGAIYQDGGSLTVTSSTISNNSADAASGGGIYLPSGSLAVLNSTISGNSADTDGGGIYSNTADTITIKHSTITLNRVSSGSHGGGVETGESASFNHTIVANNFRGSGTSTHDDVHGPFTQTNSLIGIADPRLGPLANNGGLTMTHLLLSDSPALETGAVATAGSGGVPLYDQRGTLYPRVVDYDNTGGAKLDIGAVEMPRPAPVLPGDYNLNHFADAADYVMWRKTNGTGVAQQYAGADGDGDQNITTLDYVVWREHFGNASSEASGAALDSNDGRADETEQLSNPVLAPANASNDVRIQRRSVVAEPQLNAIDAALELLIVAAGNDNRTSDTGADSDIAANKNASNTPTAESVSSAAELADMWQAAF